MKLPLQKYIAELLGTFTLAATVGMSIVYELPFTPIVAALVLGVGVYTLGPISGAHFNPAITLAHWSVKKISPRDAVVYIIAQVAAGAFAFAVVPVLAAGELTTTMDGSFWTALAELLGTFFLAVGVASVAYAQVRDDQGLVVGGSLLVGVFFASSASEGALNPAVALGVGAWSWPYVIGPVLGAMLGTWLYRWMARK